MLHPQPVPIVLVGLLGVTAGLIGLFFDDDDVVVEQEAGIESVGLLMRAVSC